MRTMLREVEAAARLEVTGLVANTHLMDETTPEIVRAGIRSARDLEAATGIPVRFCTMQHGVGRGVRRAGRSGGPSADPGNGATHRGPFAPKPRGVRRSSTVV